MIDFAQLTLTWRPNQYLVAPAGLCQNAEPHRESPTYEMAPEVLLERVRRVALGDPRTTETAGNPSSVQSVFVAKSKVFRFPDVIDVLAVDAGDGRSQIAIYSRARLGVRDFGVNKARIDRWLNTLDA